MARYLYLFILFFNILSNKNILKTVQSSLYDNNMSGYSCKWYGHIFLKMNILYCI